MPRALRLLYKSKMCSKRAGMALHHNMYVYVYTLNAPPGLMCIVRGMQSCMKTVAL